MSNETVTNQNATSAISALADLAAQEKREDQWLRQHALGESVTIFKALKADKRSVNKILPRAEEFYKFLKGTK
jgi:hypothetical protein